MFLSECCLVFTWKNGRYKKYTIYYIGIGYVTYFYILYIYIVIGIIIYFSIIY